MVYSILASMSDKLWNYWKNFTWALVTPISVLSSSAILTTSIIYIRENLYFMYLFDMNLLVNWIMCLHSLMKHHISQENFILKIVIFDWIPWEQDSSSIEKPHVFHLNFPSVTPQVLHHFPEFENLDCAEWHPIL